MITLYNLTVFKDIEKKKKSKSIFIKFVILRNLLIRSNILLFLPNTEKLLSNILLLLIENTSRNLIERGNKHKTSFGLVCLPSTSCYSSWGSEDFLVSKKSSLFK